MDRKEVLRAAEGCVCGQRQQDYGKPENNFGRIAGLWEAYTGHKYSPVDVALMLALLKVARVGSGRFHEDNFVDLAGYAALAGELAAAEELRRVAGDVLESMTGRRAADDREPVPAGLSGCNCRHAVHPVPDVGDVCAGWADDPGPLVVNVTMPESMGEAIRDLAAAVTEAVHEALEASEAADPLAAGPGPASGMFKPCTPLEGMELGGAEGNRPADDQRGPGPCYPGVCGVCLCREDCEAVGDVNCRLAAKLAEALEDEANKPRPAAGAAVAVADDEDHNAEVRNMAESYGGVAEKAMEAVHEALEASESAELPAWMTEPRVHGAPCLDGLGACEGVADCEDEDRTGRNLATGETVAPVFAGGGVDLSALAGDPLKWRQNDVAREPACVLPVAEAVDNAARTINAGKAGFREAVEQLGETLSRNLQRTARR